MVNLVAVLLFVFFACSIRDKFAKNPTPGGGLTITGSASFYFDTAPLSIYAASQLEALNLLWIAYFVIFHFPTTFSLHRLPHM